MVHATPFTVATLAIAGLVCDVSVSFVVSQPSVLPSPQALSKRAEGRHLAGVSGSAVARVPSIHANGHEQEWSGAGTRRMCTETCLFLPHLGQRRPVPTQTCPLSPRSTLLCVLLCRVCTPGRVGQGCVRVSRDNAAAVRVCLLA